MSNYMLLDGAGFRLLESVAEGIEHYEMYTGYRLTIGKSMMGKYHQYGCRIHTNSPFHVAFAYEHGSVIITMKNKNLIQLGVEESTTTKDGRKRKKRLKGQLDESFNLASSTHDDRPEPSDLKKTAVVHDGLIASYNTAWRAKKSVHTT